MTLVFVVLRNERALSWNKVGEGELDFSFELLVDFDGCAVLHLDHLHRLGIFFEDEMRNREDLEAVSDVALKSQTKTRLERRTILSAHRVGDESDLLSKIDVGTDRSRLNGRRVVLWSRLVAQHQREAFEAIIVRLLLAFDRFLLLVEK